MAIDSILHFDDQRIEEIERGEAMTADERDFLVRDTPNFEECEHTREELSAMADAELMRAAYGTWADYARSTLSD